MGIFYSEPLHIICMVSNGRFGFRSILVRRKLTEISHVAVQPENGGFG